MRGKAAASKNIFSSRLYSSLRHLLLAFACLFLALPARADSVPPTNNYSATVYDFTYYGYIQSAQPYSYYQTNCVNQGGIQVYWADPNPQFNGNPGCSESNGQGGYSGAAYSITLYTAPTCPTGYAYNSITHMCDAVCPSPRTVSGASCTLPLGSIDPYKGLGICIPCLLAQMMQGDPINSGTGNKFQIETDYAGTGIYPLRAARTYNNGGTSPSSVESAAWGAQWRGVYDNYITSGTSGTLTTAIVKRHDGRQFFFSLVNGAWVGDADVVGKLTQLFDASGNPAGWTYVNEHDETETYNATGRLASITNRAGQSQTLAYSDGTATGSNGAYYLNSNGTPTTNTMLAGFLIRVTDPAGRTLQYGYDSHNRIVKMTDPAGGVYLYTYDANNNLSSVSYPDGKTRTYLYGETAEVSATPNPGVSYLHSMTGLLDENGTRYATWTYDAAGRATSSENGATGSGINKVSMAYATPVSGNSTTSVTDVRGTIRTYNFGTMLGVVKNTGITGSACDGCSPVFGFDPNGNVSGRADFNGNSTCYLYDPARNLETVRLEGLAPVPGTTTPVACPANLSTYTPAAGSVERKITTQWHSTYRLPLAVAEPLRITTYTYDTKGNLLTRTIQPTTDPTGGAGFAAVATGTPRTWTYTYNAAGQVLTVDGPRTDVVDITTYTYDTQGNLATVTNALNQTTTLGGYDANGRVGTLTDPNGLVTTLTYDARGRLLSRNRGGETTTYTYDGAGNLTGVSLPSGASYTYTYDAAHRLTQIGDNQGNHVVYTLDTAGNRTQEQVLNSIGTVVQTRSRVFDTLNHLVQDVGAVNQTTTYTYDAAGNLKSVTDPLNRLTTNAYDALNRLNQVTNPDNGVIKYAYDEEDQLVTVTDPRNLVTVYTRDGLGNLNQSQSPDTGITSLTYDAAGNVRTRTDAKGQVATYTYDALNRVSTITYTGGTAPSQAIAYQYDYGVNGIGRLTGITDSTGITAFTYNQKGRLTAQTEQAYGGTYTTAYTWDTQGRLSGMTYPSGRTLSYSFDVQGRVASISTTSPTGKTQLLASSITYEPFGPVHGFNYGDGLTAPVQTYTRNRDQDGRIASYTLNNGRTMSILYDASSQIVTVSDSTSPLNPANYGYDPMSRLNSYTQGTAGQSYSYDVDGNRTSQTIGTTTTGFAYGTTSNWLTQNGVNAVTHDANGATTGDATRTYAYDLRGRLIQTQTAQGVVNYEINALGLRVRKQVPYAGTDTEYHYDAAGHLISEGNTGTAAFTREYIWLGDLPVVVMK